MCAYVCACDSMCSKCAQGWGRVGDACVACPDPSIMTLAAVASVLLMCFILAFMIRSNMKAKDRTRSGYQKILLNHVQVITVATSLAVRWPSFMYTFFQVTAVPGGAQGIDVRTLYLSLQLFLTRFI